VILGRAFAALSLVAAAFGPPPPLPPAPDTGAALPVSDARAQPPPDGPLPLEFMPLVQTLARLTACAPKGTIPERFDARVVDAHCKELVGLEDHWRQGWLAQARPFFVQNVPADLPNRIVYPFGGGDLRTALVTFPPAVEITTLSLEPAGDPRAVEALMAEDLEPTLAEVRVKVNHLFHYGHSKTIDMGKMAKSKLPGDLTYALVALEMNGFDPVSVRFFHLASDGQVQYMTQPDLDAGEAQGRHGMFANMEIEFQPRAGGPRRTFRHIAANLDDKHLSVDPSVLRHLEAKGEVAAITKAASYLLWWKEFGQIRGYLLKNMVWMISDSTGVPPDEAKAAGFEQIPYGRFDGPFLGGGIRPTQEFKKLWAERAQPLAFRFGYPDIGNHDHLLITRRPAK
jgi:hypothetical protein